MSIPEPSSNVKRIRWGWWIVGLLLLLVVGVFLLLPAISPCREAARRIHCINHLKKIGIAMHAYHDKHGCFPPAYVADEQGRPMHGWRVLILPYLGERELYDEYDFTQPWDSPRNRALAANIPDCYRCPNDLKARDADTSYVMIVGPGTISDGPNSTTLEDFDEGDGANCTIAVVEMSNSGINWLHPRDLNFECMSFIINDDYGRGIRSGHTEYHPVVQVLLADGSVHTLQADIDPELLRVLITVAGGEDLGNFSNDW